MKGGVAIDGEAAAPGGGARAGAGGAGAHGMSDDLPTGWTTKRGSDLFSFVTSGSRGWAQHYASTGALFLRMTNVGHDSISLDLRDLKYVRPPQGAEGTRTRVVPGDLLISITADVGRVALAPAGIGEAYINQHLALARPAGEMDARYLAWYLASAQGGQAQFQQLRRGATKVGLGLDDIAELRIPVPPLPEQKRIVATVDALLAQVAVARERLTRVREILKRFRESVVAAACSGRLTEQWRVTQTSVSDARDLIEGTPLQRAELPALPDRWRWCTMEQVADIRGGIQKQPKRQPRQNSHPYLRVANVPRGRLELAQLERMELFDGELDIYRLHPGDLLVVEGNGSINEIGRCAVWSGEIRDCVHQNHIIRARPRRCSPRYLEAYWNSAVGIAQVANAAVTTSGLYSLSTRKVAGLPVPIPPLDEQNEIVRRVSDLWDAAGSVEAAVKAGETQTARLPHAVLAAAFRGELNRRTPT